MSLPILTVVGALGAQGGGVVNAFTSESTPQYQVRALTSNASSPAAVKLSEHPHVTVVQVDLNSIESIQSAFEGSTLIFANTAFPITILMEKGAQAAEEHEAKQGLNIVQAAARVSGLEHLIWSTLPEVTASTGGKFTIPDFQSKIPAEAFCRSSESGLADKTTFLGVGMYGSNVEQPPYKPVFEETSKTYLFIMPCSSDAVLPFIGDERANVGAFAKAIFAQPDKTAGRYVDGSSEHISCRQWAAAMQSVLQKSGSDRRVVHVDCSLANYEEIWGPFGTEVGTIFKYFDEYGLKCYERDADGRRVLTADDLGIAHELKSTEDRLATVEWF